MPSLRRGRLAIEVLRPGIDYTGTRFDHCGMIGQVLVDGRHHFCTLELPEAPAMGGIGLCNEFGIFSPVGYDAVPAGGWFPKIGVGLLQRDAAAYDFFHRYPCQPAAITVRSDEHEICFQAASQPCGEYAIAYEKRIRIDEDSIVVSFSLHNQGRAALVTTEYCHNFLAPGGLAPGSGLHLSFGDRQHRWTGAPTGPERYVFGGGGPGCCWELRDGRSGLGMRESCSRSLSERVLFTAPGYCSPEAFVAIDLPPGGQQRWERRYDLAVDGRWLDGSPLLLDDLEQAS